jgi:hypothetical protein
LLVPFNWEWFLCTTQDTQDQEENCETFPHNSEIVQESEIEAVDFKLGHYQSAGTCLPPGSEVRRRVHGGWLRRWQWRGGAFGLRFRLRS